MTLPLSRDYDATDAGPLPHTTVNNIQDAIIGGKHGSITLQIPACAGASVFDPGFNEPGMIPGIAGSMQRNPAAAGFEILRAPVTLPFGAKITEVKLEGSRGTSAGTFTFSLERTLKSTGGVTVVAGPTATASGTDAAGDMTTNVTFSGLSEIIGATTTYVLVADFIAGGAVASAGVFEITYEMP
jgi:hypothetical protein